MRKSEREKELDLSIKNYIQIFGITPQYRDLFTIFVRGVFSKGRVDGMEKLSAITRELQGPTPKTQAKAKRSSN